MIQVKAMDFLQIKGQEIAKKARQGDPLCREILEKYRTLYKLPGSAIAAAELISKVNEYQARVWRL